MKVIILAMDGLDYDLVVKWRLRSLMQKVYGWIDVTHFYIPEVKDILTPAVWASFITGVSPEVHGIRRLWIGPSLLGLRDKLPQFIRYPLSKFMRRMRIYKPPTRENLYKKGLSTIFDGFKSYVKDFPAYNEPLEVRNRLIEASKGGLKRYAEEVWRVNKERVNELMKVINEDYDIIAVWLDLADKVGHIYIRNNILQVIKAYLYLNKVAHDITSLAKNKFTIIVSDHGMHLSGLYHKPKAFYSFSHDVGVTPKRIEDFKDIILDIVCSTP